MDEIATRGGLAFLERSGQEPLELPMGLDREDGGLRVRLHGGSDNDLLLSVLIEDAGLDFDLDRGGDLTIKLGEQRITVLIESAEPVEVDIAGISKAEVLAALYNAARPRNGGAMIGGAVVGKAPMSVEQAEALIDKEGLRFVNRIGGVTRLGVKIDGDTFDARLYERWAGEGAAEAAIAPLRSGA